MSQPESPAQGANERTKLETELAELEAKVDAATSWGAAIGARYERIKGIRAHLAALDSRAAAFSPTESGVVSERDSTGEGLDPLAMLLDAARFIQYEKPAWAAAARKSVAASRSPSLVAQGIEGSEAKVPGDILVKVLLDALEPFTRLGGPNDGVMPAFHDIPDDVVVYKNSGQGITAGDVRHARNAFGLLHAPWPLPAPATTGDGADKGAGYIVKLINHLREEEGDSVTILCDNPEGPPDVAIECNGAWTGWEDKRFVGADLIEALSAAYLQCIQLRAAVDYGKKWSGADRHSPAEAAAPEGWRLVPLRPSETQMNAGLYQSSADATFADVYSSYVDMVNAAPTLDDYPDAAQAAEDANRQLVSEIQQIRAELAEARGAVERLRASLEGHAVKLMGPRSPFWRCQYCEGLSQSPIKPFPHKPECVMAQEGQS